MTPVFARVLSYLDTRAGTNPSLRALANKTFPRHWTFLLGEVALFSFVILVLTGIFLAMFYRPSMEPVVYTGSAQLFAGRELPAAFASIVTLSHDVQGGLLFRRVHRAAATVFIGAIILHFARVVLQGAFRKPRELNYHVGLALAVLAVASGYSGHNLIWDVLAGTSLRIFYTFLVSVPWVGEFLAQWVFGGEFPGEIVPRLFAVHVVVLPALIAGAIAVHLALVFRQTHTQQPHPIVDGERIVAGQPLWPAQAAASTTLFLALAALLGAAAVLVPWSDVELHGPYVMAQASNASQPDWFLFWIEGALRLYPGLDLHLLGTTLTGPFVTGVLLPLALTALLFTYPGIERRVVGGACERGHHVAQHPLDVPLRAGFFAGLAVLLLVLTAAAGTDVFARALRAPIEQVVWGFRVGVVILPPAAVWGAVAAARRHRRLGEVAR